MTDNQKKLALKILKLDYENKEVSAVDVKSAHIEASCILKSENKLLCENLKNVHLARHYQNRLETLGIDVGENKSLLELAKNCLAKLKELGDNYSFLKTRFVAENKGYKLTFKKLSTFLKEIEKANRYAQDIK